MTAIEAVRMEGKDHAKFRLAQFNSNTYNYSYCVHGQYGTNVLHNISNQVQSPKYFLNKPTRGEPPRSVAQFCYFVALKIGMKHICSRVKIEMVVQMKFVSEMCQHQVLEQCVDPVLLDSQENEEMDFKN